MNIGPLYLKEAALSKEDQAHLLYMLKYTADKQKFLGLPVEGSIIQQSINADMLLQEAVSQDGHRGEADVVHRQIGRIIQGLGSMRAARDSEVGGVGGGRKEEEGWGNWGLISRRGQNSYPPSYLHKQYVI